MLHLHKLTVRAAVRKDGTRILETENDSFRSTIAYDSLGCLSFDNYVFFYKNELFGFAIADTVIIGASPINHTQAQKKKYQKYFYSTLLVHHYSTRTTHNAISYSLNRHNK